MFIYKKAETDKELSQIIALQKQNLPDVLSPDERKQQGFVTVVHPFSVLKKMNACESHVIIKNNDIVVGYLLAMTKASKNAVDILKPMFEVFNNIFYKNKRIADANYLVVGQVCIAKKYRGMGLLDTCYKAYKNFYSKKYDFAITEIATNNKRSINAHKRIGFTQIYNYVDTMGTEWSVVIWNWN